jgi:hypothetical protein
MLSDEIFYCGVQKHDTDPKQVRTDSLVFPKPDRLELSLVRQR